MTLDEKERVLERRRRKYHANKKGKNFFIPNSPSKFAASLNSLIEGASPRKKAELRKFGIEKQSSTQMTENISQSMLELKKSRKSVDRKELQTLVKAAGSTETIKPVESMRYRLNTLFMLKTLFDSITKNDIAFNKRRTEVKMKEK